MAKRRLQLKFHAYLATVTGETGQRSPFIVLARNHAEAAIVLKRYMYPKVGFGYIVEVYRKGPAIVAAGLVEAYTKQTEGKDAQG